MMVAFGISFLGFFILELSSALFILVLAPISIGLITRYVLFLSGRTAPPENESQKRVWTQIYLATGILVSAALSRYYPVGSWGRLTFGVGAIIIVVINIGIVVANYFFSKNEKE
jgi:hypothetical protein